MKEPVLVIGGAGYIGSHMTRTLLEAGYQAVVFDNLSTGHREMVPSEAVYIEGDLQSASDVKQLFQQFDFSAVVHFAASSIVPESVRSPLKYYRNNVSAFLNLLDGITERGVKRLIFSSTAAVYGESKKIPILEDFPAQPLNPYGRSKWMMEQILADVALTHPMNYVIFRYFNAAGAHACGELGERHNPETHLIPNLLAAACDDKKKFTMFGDDYPTADGTCVRDYIHVGDLCRAHLQALQYLERGGSSEVFNLGSEKGYSVKEVIRVVEQIIGKKVPVEIAARRPGDPPALIADSQKAKRILGWKAEESLETILRSAYQWYQNDLNEKLAGQASCAAKKD